MGSRAAWKLGALLCSCSLLLPACSTGSETAPDELIFQLRTDHPQRFVSKPTFLLYGDGRLVYRPLYAEAEPMPRMLVRRLEPEAREALLASAVDGLDEIRSPLSFGSDREWPVTTVSTVVDGETTEVRIEAIDRYLGTRDRPWEEREARYKAIEFYARLFYLTDWLPEGSVGEPESYEFDRLLVLSSPGVARPVDEPAGIEWPLDDLAQSGIEVVEEGWPDPRRCRLVDGDDLAKVREALEQRSQDAGWISGGRIFYLEFHPLLEGEPGCDGSGSP